MLFILFAFLQSTIWIPVHKVPLAVFHITESNTTIQMAITFDLADFSESSEIKPDEVNLRTMQKYLDKNLILEFNTQEISFEISEVKMVKDHLKVKGSFGEITQKIKNLEVKNTCLNNISRHSNIIQIDLNNESKDYRMHKNRRVIRSTY